MKTVFTFGGSNPIELKQSDNKQGRFILSYGYEVKRNLTYAQAAKALGEAMLHHLACEGQLNNEGV